MNCLLTNSDKWSSTVFRMLLLSFPLFLLSMTRREKYIFTCLAIDRSSELHGAIRDTIAGSSHYLFSLDKFAARIRHKIHCACNDYAKPPEMQQHELIVIDLNNDRGCGRRTSVLQRHDENGNMKKGTATATGTTYNHVQTSPNSWYSFVLLLIHVPFDESSGIV